MTDDPSRANAHSLQTRRANAMTATTTEQQAVAPPVIVTVPADRMPVALELLVRHEPWGVEVDVRPAGTGLSWTPLAAAGGSFEVRSA